MKRKQAGKKEGHPRGPMLITIHGRAKAGKSYLARFLALTLANTGHSVTILDAEGQDFNDASVGRIMNKMAQERQPIAIKTHTTLTLG